MRFARTSRGVSAALLAVLILVTLASPSWGQRGIPIRFSPPVVRPVGPHIVPHVVHTGQTHSSSDSSDVIWIIVGAIAAVAVGVAAIFGIRAWMRSSKPMLIRIIAAPPGEAPEEIRQEWIGVELPLAPGEPLPKIESTVGVLTGQSTGVASGYLVEGNKAVALLAAHSPTAAEWWREAAPHILVPGYKLSFPAEVCELMS
jgi:hypothetical protein